MHASLVRGDSGARLALSGAWRATAVRALEAELAAIEREVAAAPVAPLEIDVSGLESIDLSGAWVLHEFAQRRGAAGAEVRWVPEAPETLRLVQRTLRPAPQPAVPASGIAGAAPSTLLETLTTDRVEDLGREAVRRWNAVLDGLSFVGLVFARFAQAMVDPRRWRPISVARHVFETGIKAIPIVSLIAFLISVIMAYMGAQQLRKFGADIFVVDLVTVGVLRELGVLLTAIIIAGRSGSAFAAEIGAMKLNEEIDALKATGVDPVEVLVVPRILGLVIALPLLTVIANAVGLAGGALLCRTLLDMPFVQFFERMDESIGPWTFWVGIIKAPVFALLIAAAGTYRGLQVRSSSRELGRLTTVAVVQAIFLVILADALFAVLFMELDI